MKNETCKNAKIELIDKEYVNTGCKNLRANGSSRCQECSDKYKNEKEIRN